MYNKEKVNFPIIVSFEKKASVKTYKIFTQKYFDKIYEDMKFNHSLLLIGNSCQEYDKNKMCQNWHIYKSYFIDFNTK